jgi:hypothetical protein
VRDLAKARSVRIVELQDCPPAAVNALHSARGQDLQPTFREAVRHLRAYLEARDPDLALRCASWQALEIANIAIAPGLEVDVDLGDRLIRVPVPAQASRDPLTIFARSEEALGSSDGAGWVVATVFRNADRDKVALAWERAWGRAKAGEFATVFGLAETPQPSAQVDGLHRLEALRRRGSSAGRGRTTAAKVGSTSAPPVPPPPAIQRLKLPSELRIGRGGIADPEATKGGVKHVERRGLRTQLPSSSGSPGLSRAWNTVPGYTQEELEAAAVHVLRLFLGRDDTELRDFTHQRGIGADTVDELLGYFEIKAHGGPAPDTESLTGNEVAKAIEQGDKYFLAVVSGLEADQETMIRIIADPLRTLDLVPAHGLVLGGVLSRARIEYRVEAVGAIDAETPTSDATDD